MENENMEKIDIVGKKEEKEIKKNEWFEKEKINEEIDVMYKRERNCKIEEVKKEKDKGK